MLQSEAHFDARAYFKYCLAEARHAQTVTPHRPVLSGSEVEGDTDDQPMQQQQQQQQPDGEQEEVEQEEGDQRDGERPGRGRPEGEQPEVEQMVGPTLKDIFENTQKILAQLEKHGGQPTQQRARTVTNAYLPRGIVNDGNSCAYIALLMAAAAMRQHRGPGFLPDNTDPLEPVLQTILNGGSIPITEIPVPLRISMEPQQPQQEQDVIHQYDVEEVFKATFSQRGLLYARGKVFLNNDVDNIVETQGDIQVCFYLN